VRNRTQANNANASATMSTQGRWKPQTAPNYKARRADQDKQGQQTKWGKVALQRVASSVYRGVPVALQMMPSWKVPVRLMTPPDSTTASAPTIAMSTWFAVRSDQSAKCLQSALSV